MDKPTRNSAGGASSDVAALRHSHCRIHRRPYPAKLGDQQTGIDPCSRRHPDIKLDPGRADASGSALTACGSGDPKALAIRPLAFPTIVSPQGVGVLIIFVAFLSSLSSTITILTVAGVIVLLDYGAMRIAHWFMATVGMVPLLVLGAVFGVLQVALGIEMMLSGLLLVLNS